MSARGFCSDPLPLELMFDPDARVPGEYSSGSIGVLIGEDVNSATVDDVLWDVRFMAGCKAPVHPLGQVYDDMGTPHYAFVVHPSDTDAFRSARFDTRWRGRLAWADEESQCSPYPDEFVDFIF